ncbi:MAG: helix-turn-helix transcriptional regulator [Anaerolineales bacterium]|jgi:putative transcriptional regulator
MKDKLSNSIKEYRLSRGLTQGDLAEAVGVSRQSINSIERGRYIPSLPLALKFGQVFACSIEELFQLQEDHHG